MMVLYFDGICNLCSWAVQFILKRDHKDQFYFSSLQSRYAQNQLDKHGIQSLESSSVILQSGEQLYFKSEAVFKVLSQLGGLWKLLLIFQILPSSLTDSVYDLVAKNRYSWFGKKDQCMVPEPGVMDKFLE